MPKTLSADFDTRRDAEMAVEHIVQEHGVDRNAVTILPVSDANSAGIRPSGSDMEDRYEKVEPAGEPALAGRLRVSVEVEGAGEDKVRESFATYGGKGCA